MLRIHFTGEDLARLRMAPGPDTLWETILSFHRLRDRRGASVFGEWRQETRGPVERGNAIALRSRSVPGIFPRLPYAAAGSAFPGIRSGANSGDRTRAAERGTLPAARRSSGERLGGRARRRRQRPTRPPRRRVGRTTTGRPSPRTGRTYRPASMPTGRPAGRALLDGGAGELLASLPPMLRWRDPVLEADYPVDRELHLDGRGLLLQPSFFCRRTPVALQDPKLPPVLVYPVTHTQAPVRVPAGPRARHPRSAAWSATPAPACSSPSGTAAPPVNSPAGQASRSPPPASTPASCATPASWSRCGTATPYCIR